MKIKDWLNFWSKKPEVEVKEVGSGGSVAGAVSVFLGGRSISNRFSKNLVFVALDAIAKNVSNGGWELYKLKSDESVEVLEEDHFLRKILEKPNGNENFNKFLYRWAGIYKLMGEVIIYIKKNAGRTKLFILDDYSVEVNDWGEIVGVKRKGQKLNMENVVIHRNPDFVDFRNSAGMGEKIKDWIEVDSNAVDLAKRMTRDGVFLGGFLKTPIRNEEQLRKVEQRLREKYQGKDNASKIMVGTEGMEFVPIGGSAKELEFGATDERFTKKMLQAFGVPPAVLGDVDGKGRANVEGSFYAFAKFTLLPLMREMKEIINNEIIPKLYDGEQELIFVDFENPVPKDKEFELLEKKTSLAGKAWRTVNEVREMEGREPIEGGEELPVSLFGLKKKAPERLLRKLKAKQQEKEEVKKMIEEIGEKAGLVDEAMREMIHQKFIGRVDQRKYQVKEVVEGELDKVMDEVLNRLPEFKTKAEGDDLFDKEQMAIEIYAGSSEVIEKLINEEGNGAWELIPNASGNFKKTKRLEKELQRLWKLRGESFAETTEKKLWKVIREGIKEGWSLDEIGDEVEKVVKRRKEHAVLLAQDLVFDTANAVMREAYEQSGVVKAIKWHTAEDEKVCSFCNSFHGKVIDIEEDFAKKGDVIEVGGEKMRIDFMSVKHPPLHGNCRCMALPEIISY